jgi:hypothetical protein
MLITRATASKTLSGAATFPSPASDTVARAGLALRNDLTRPGSATGYVLLVAKPQNGFLLLWDTDGDGYVESVARAETGVTPYPATPARRHATSRSSSQ